jgi:hypothetical protein
MDKKELLHQTIEELTHLEKAVSEEDRKLKADVLTIERLRKFFDGPNFVQADLTRDAFYKIVHASKLEANGHKEQRP